MGLSDRIYNSTMRSIYCTHCRYNLTGNRTHECPECGTPFDPDERQRTYQTRRTHTRLFARRTILAAGVLGGTVGIAAVIDYFSNPIPLIAMVLATLGVVTLVIGDVGLAMTYEMIERHDRARDELGRINLRSLTAFISDFPYDTGQK